MLKKEFLLCGLVACPAILAGCGSMLERAAITEPAWDADAFGSCCKTTNMQFRDAQCRNVWDGLALDKSACVSLPKPCQTTECACGTMKCDEDAETCSPAAPSAAKCESAASQKIEPIALGCIDDVLPSVSDTTDAYDETCMTCSGDEPCHGGLPFYRQRMSGATPKDCLDFCTKKGLDLAGLVSGGGECRCGASPLNTAIEPRPCLQLKLQSLFASNTSCPVAVYRYSGHYEDGSLPADLQDMIADDTEYVDTVAQGHRLKSEPPGGEAEFAVEPGIAAAAGNQGSDRNCWPSNCGPGGGPWARRGASPPAGVSDNWQEYVTVKYVFESSINQARKNAFYEAAKRIRAVTCINVVEDGSLNDPTNFDFKVGVYDTGSCYVMGMGNQKKWRKTSVSKLNLGWCNNNNHIGSMVHEIGHVLGMNHEQKRPDAQESYQGRGPHLRMKWSNIPGSWRSQWTPDASSYTGSKNDGSGDPHQGYAPYDFGSIMHYPIRGKADTIPSSQASLVGNRKKLSAGDIRQLNDVYQCKAKTGGGGGGPISWPTPAPTPSAPTSCVDTTGNCKSWASQYCNDSTYKAWMSTNCKRSCGLCGASTGGSSCSWKTPTTTNDMLQCVDGSTCFGWSCCVSKGGRAKCPANAPIMCNYKTCGGGTQHCCSSDCTNAGGERSC